MSTENIETTAQDQAPQGTSSNTDLLAALGSKAKPVLGIAIAVVVIVAGYFYYTSSQDAKNQEGLTHLARIRATFDAGEYAKALTADSIPPVGDNAVKGLITISQEYSGTDAGSIAALMAGNALVNLGRFDEALGQFELAQSSSSIIVEVGALQGLASVKESQKDLAGAAALYEKAASKADKTGLEERAILRAAQCYEKSGNTQKATELYRTVIKKFEMSDVAAAARGGLARLGMAID